jgi:hypothetical protein
MPQKTLKARREYNKEYMRKQRLDPVKREKFNAAQRRHYAKYRKKYIQKAIEYYKAHPESKKKSGQRYHAKHWDRHLRSKYNLTEAQYIELLSKQHGVCSICHQPETQKKRGKVVRLAVDHDHQTKIVRGLLCARCNMALGQFNSVTRLQEALQYLTDQISNI